MGFLTGRKIRSMFGNPIVPFFFLFLVLYVFSSGAHFYGPDDIIVYSTTQAIAQRGSMDITSALPLIHAYGGGGFNEHYSKYGILPSLLAVPLFFMGILARVQPWRIVALLYSPIITATSVCILFLTAKRLGESRYLSAILATLYGTATLAWFYSKTFTDLTTASLMLLAAIYFVLNPIKDLKSTILCSFFTVLSVFASITQALAIPGLVAYIIMSRPEKSRLKSLALFIIPMLAGGLVYLYLNVIRFGSPLNFGYGGESFIGGPAYGTNPLVGIYGLLFSSGEGLFIYYPLSALGIIGLSLKRGYNNWTRFMFAWIFLSTLIFYSTFHEWYGGGAWGARYLLATMPYLTLGLGPLIKSARQSLTHATAIIFATAIGVFSNIMGVFVNFLYIEAYLWDMGAYEGSNFPYPGIWIPQFSQVRASWDLLWSSTYPAKFFWDVGNYPMFFLQARLDLALYYLFGLPILVLTVAIILAISYWLIRALKQNHNCKDLRTV